MTSRTSPIALGILAVGALLAAGVWIGINLTGSSAPVAADRGDEPAPAPDGEDTDAADSGEDAAGTPTDADSDDTDVNDSVGSEREEPLEDGVVRTERAIATSGTHTCARHPDGGVSCWGRDDRGQSGGTSVSNEPAPTTRIDGLEDVTVTDLAVEGRISCALTSDEDLWCWGGLQNPNDSSDRRPLRGGGARQVFGFADQPAVTAMDAGPHHVCGVLADGTLHCIGYDHARQLGHFEETTPGVNAFEQVEHVADVVDVAVGFDHTCALHDDGRVSCWGDNEHRQLGDHTLDASRDPVVVEGVDNAVSLVGAPWRSCAIDHTGAVTCWGANLPGGPADQGTTPPVELPMFDRVATISHHSWEVCAVETDSQLRCVGESALLLDDELQASQPPVDLDPFGLLDDAPVMDVGVSARSCAVMADGEVRCWGLGSDGLLGGAYRPSHGPLWLPPSPVVDLDPVG